MNNAKYAFYYLLSLVALVFVAVNSGIVVFQIINKLIPDALNNYSDSVSQEMIRFAIASLVFATPVFYWMNKLIKTGLVKGEIELTAGIRRWLTYFIIFVASVVILIWLITTMNSFLNGELTTKVILKTLTILLIAGSVFGYYFYDIKQAAIKPQDKFTTIFFIGSLSLVVVIFVSAIMVMDKPSVVRAQRHDIEVINHLSSIENAINNYYSINKSLPTNLEELVSSNTGVDQSMLVDPNSKAAHSYRAIDATTFELCAEFSYASEPSAYKTGYSDPMWRHQVGQQCFKRVVNNNGLPVMVK